MSGHPHACSLCLRRGWLLAQLAPYLEKHLGERSRPGVFELLGLSNEDLASAVAPGAAQHLIAQVEALSERSMRATLASSGCWALCCHDSLYPSGLRFGEQAPSSLFGRGDPRLLVDLAGPAAAFALVGARRATSYGREVARSLGRDLAAAGLTVISGMAFGIDACAHRGALEAGHTVAVLRCGPDVAYPATHRALWRRIQESGLVLSELPPGTGAWRWSFSARSRIIAGLSGTTVVVEAAEGSGSLTVAERAADLGRSVGAVPGPVSSRSSAGSNALLADGARLIRGAQDLLDAMPATRSPAKLADADHPLDVRRAAAAIIGEDRVPAEILSELVDNYGPEEEGEGR